MTRQTLESRYSHRFVRLIVAADSPNVRSGDATVSSYGDGRLIINTVGLYAIPMMRHDRTIEIYSVNCRLSRRRDAPRLP